MAGRTISAHADEETAKLVESVAKAEDRPASQIVVAALKFYMRLPAEARAAIRTLEAFGTPDEIQTAIRRTARTLIDAEFDVTERRMAEQMRLPNEEALQTDESILAEAVRLTRRGR
jgi:hypothetical protein